MSTKRDRNHLKTYFETGDRPTEEEFAELIDSGLNQKDDDIHADGNQNIGIGTDTPGAKLEVNGDLIVDDDAQVKGRLIGKDGNASQFLIQSSKQGAAGGAYVHMHGSERTSNPQGDPHGNQGGFTFVASGNGKNNGFSFLHFNVDNHNNVPNDGNSETWHRSVRINGHGNVGIGLGGDEPEDKLHVNGTIRTEENIVLKGSLVDHPDNTGNNDVLQIFNNSSVQLYGVDHPNRPGDLSLNTNSTNAGGNIHFNENTGNGWRNNMVIQSGGNVGVGTDDPQSRLHVISPNGSDTGLTLSGQAGINDGDILSTDGTGKVKWVPKTDVTSGLWKDAGNQNIENGNSGNVGIGNVPGQSIHSKIQISGTYESPVDPAMNGIARIQGNEGYSSANLRLGVYKDPSKNKGYSWIESVNGPLSLNQGSQKLVGIGLAQPTAKLEVMDDPDNENSNGIIKIAGKDTGKDLRFGVMGGNTPYTWIQSHGAVPLKLNPHPAGNVTTINEGAGNVGIGTVSPNHKLDVDGNANFSGNVKIKNDFPILIKRFTSNVNMVSNATIFVSLWLKYDRQLLGFDTGVSFTKYPGAAISGFSGEYDDHEGLSHENDKVGAGHKHKFNVVRHPYMSVFKKNGTWHVAGHESHVNGWNVDVMFFREGIVETTGNWNEPLNNQGGQPRLDFHP